MLLLDEIRHKSSLSKLGEKSIPESVRLILVLNPRDFGSDSKESLGHPLTLPPSFLHVTLTTTYRSTIALTKLARFIAKCKGLYVPEEDFGSDVVGTKPMFFDVGKDERKMKEALEHCRKHLGDNVTTLYDTWKLIEVPNSLGKLVKEKGKEAGGPWEHCNAGNFVGWEAERVVVVTTGFSIMEVITRAQTHLAVILADTAIESAFKTKTKIETMNHFQQAAGQGLIGIVHLGETTN